MDLEKDLENLRRTCELQVSSNEIVITSLDACKFTPDHNITVKPEVEDAPKVASEDFPTSKEEVGNGPVGFSIEKEIPDFMSVKVYDFVMSKEKTLPASTANVPDFAERQLRRKWLWIIGLIISSLIIIGIVLVVILNPGSFRSGTPNSRTVALD